MNGFLAIAVAVSSILGAFIGYVGAVFTFRSKFETNDVRHNALVAQIERDRVSDKRALDMQVEYFNETLRRIERQSLATLQLVANLAHKHGVDKRNIGEDVLADFLTRDIDK